MLRKSTDQLRDQRIFQFLLLLLVVLLARPALAGRRASIKQFEQGLADAKGKPDKEFARWVFGFDLNERVSAARLARWKEGVAGEEARRALGALADLSAFQNLPGDEIPKSVALDKEGQQRVISAAGIYVEQTLTKLPNFFATQAVTTFEDTPQGANGFYEPMHYSDFTSAMVLYRNGREVMETHKGMEVSEQDQTASMSAGLLSSGEFGPILRTVLTDAQSGKLGWGHWETSGAKVLAVFRYSVTQSHSHYKAKLLLPNHGTPFQVRPAYHGEIGIDPETGTILRFVLRADLSDGDPMTQADLMVEYGSIEIGQKSYTCPVRSVARVMVFQNGSAPAPAPTVGARTMSYPSMGDTGLQTILNDVVFGHYQVLRSEAKVITGADMEDDPEKQ